jgi:branched-chain amino acid aminotransferase
VVERSIDRTELYIAEEAFFCGSAAEVTPILSVDRHVVGDGKPGRIAKSLLEAYLAIARGTASDLYGYVRPIYADAPKSGVRTGGSAPARS